MVKKLLFLIGILIPAVLSSQQNVQPPKFALVIGNSAYTSVTRLNNPVNDAQDIAGVLEGYGFTVESVINGSLDQMENGIVRLKNRLSTSKDSYGFLFYAGHGVQFNGENFLLPVDANIPSENFLRQRSVSVQSMLDELNDAGNFINIVILDACRDNPFGWRRSGSRGLAIIGNQPADSIVVYATSAGSTAADGEGRNGLFTEHFLNNLKVPGMEVNEMFRRTMGDVLTASKNQQRPAVYSHFPGLAYLSPPPGGNPAVPIIPDTAGKAEPAVTGELASVVQPMPLPDTKPARPETPQRKKPEPEPAARLNSLGISLGTAFAAPLVAGTVRWTFAPANFWFFEFGMDMGFGTTIEYADYFSLYPYIHYNVFAPFKSSGAYRKGGWYFGMGVGYQFSQYTFDTATLEYYYLAGEKAMFSTFAVDAVTGFNIADAIDISYTLKTNFRSVNNKLSVGYTLRFK